MDLDVRATLLGDVSRLREGQRQLDLTCGKGAMLCRWAAHFGTGGLGVDLSQVFLAAARARAEELGVTGRVRFEHGDATDTVGDAGAYDTGSYDVVSCIGATWIGGGVGGTIDLMRPAMAPGGLMLIGEPYWTEPPPAEAHAAMGVARDEFTSLVGTMDRFEAVGMRLVEMMLADGDSWDRYVASQWWTVTRWLDVNGNRADAPEAVPAHRQRDDAPAAGRSGAVRAWPMARPDHWAGGGRGAGKARMTIGVLGVVRRRAESPLTP